MFLQYTDKSLFVFSTDKKLIPNEDKIKILERRVIPGSGDKRFLIEVEDSEAFRAVSCFSKELVKIKKMWEKNSLFKKLEFLSAITPVTYSYTSVGDIIPLHKDITRINFIGKARLFSIIIYLNNNFEGGDLFFPFLNKKITPSPGLIVTYPSNEFLYSHYSDEIKTGKKYILQGYLGVHDFF